MKSDQQPGFFFFFDWLDDCADLDAQTQIEFVRAIAHYAKTGEKPENLSTIVSLLTRSIFREVNLQKRKREQIRERRAMAGKLGNAKRWGQSQSEKSIAKIANATNAISESQTSLNLNQDQDLNLNQEIKKNSPKGEQKKEQKILVKFGQRIAMTAEEHAKLCEEFGKAETQEALATADDWLLSKGKVQKDYAAFMRNWLRRNAARNRIDMRRSAPKQIAPIDYENSVARLRAEGFDVIEA